MDTFTYHNIFDTKGIEYIIIIAFLILLIPFWMNLNKKVNLGLQLSQAVGSLTARILRIPQGIFFNKNHTWAFLEESGMAKVGIDDLIQHVTGKVQLEILKQPDEYIKKGEILAKIHQDKKKLTFAAPISGKVMEKNSSLHENPEYFNQDPYDLGWLYKIKPSNWREETSSFLMADKAADWIKNELERFKDFLAASTAKLSSEPMMVLQEGGEIKDHVLHELPEEVWDDFQEEFLE